MKGVLSLGRPRALGLAGRQVAPVVAEAEAERLGQDPEPLIERAKEVLREVFPESYEPPAAVHVTRWGSDPFSLCSYATTTVGITADDFERLADPVEGRVLFAGEATFRERAGFVEGAMGSGIREARRVLGRDVDLTL